MKDAMNRGVGGNDQMKFYTMKRRIQFLGIMVAMLGCGPLNGAETEAVTMDKSYPFEAIRNPFWPVDFFPENWFKSDEERENAGAAVVLEWEAPSKMIHVTGTSRMMGKTMVIINGKLKAPGEMIEIHHNGRIYQWELLGITAEGNVNLRRNGVRSERNGY